MVGDQNGGRGGDNDAWRGTLSGNALAYSMSITYYTGRPPPRRPTVVPEDTKMNPLSKRESETRWRLG